MNYENYLGDYENYRKEIVTLLAYLLGVKDDILKSESTNYILELIDKYENDDTLKIIRSLSLLRINFLQSSKAITANQQDLIPIEMMSDIVDVEAIKFLRKKNLEVIKVNSNVNTIIAIINQFIHDNIDKIKEYIPDWIKWDYIRNLFLMPGCNAGVNCSLISNKSNEKRIFMAINKVKSMYFYKKNFYPFGVYLYWPEDKMESYYGNILFNDEKFLKLLYSGYGETFHANNYVIDAPTKTKDMVYDFIDQAQNISVLVDCENVDPFRFAAVFTNLDDEKIKKIKKVILFDDVNTSNAWDYIGKIIDLPIEHNLVNRLLENKSLVDIAMATGACKEYYENNTESLILASSDSDFWGLVTGLPMARFLVLNESDKTSAVILNALKENNISYCYMDNFAQADVQEFKEKLLYSNLKTVLDDFNENGNFMFEGPNALLDYLFSMSRITGPIDQINNEKESFYKKYLKHGFSIVPIEKDDKIIYKMEILKK